MKHIFLSHAMTPVLPIYGGQGKPQVELVKDPCKGDSSTVCRLTFENHWGTHIDGTAHFFKGGQPISEYPADFWIFNAPAVVRLSLEEGQIVMPDQVCPHVPPEADIVLLNSGWSQWRTQDKYSCRGPGLSAELGKELRKRFLQLRAIGMDWVSASSYLHRDIGRDAHRAFLDPQSPGRPILLIEDMNFSSIEGRLQEVFVFPFRFEGIDSAPCTVIGALND
jgi:arylformamidase